MVRFVICEINENYLKNVKEQMKKQNMPVPNNDTNITIAHKPLLTIEKEIDCSCEICRKFNSV